MKYFLEYRNKIMRNVGRSDTTTEDKIVDAFNDAQRFLASEVDMSSMQSIVTVNLEKNKYIYTYDEFDISDVRHIVSIVLYDEERYHPPMTRLTPLQFQREVDVYIHSLSGKPTAFTEFEKVLKFNSNPDSANYTIDISFYYYANEVYDTMSEVYFTDFDVVLISLATAYTWLRLEEVELYKEWMQKAMGEMKLYNKDFRYNVDAKGKSRSRENTGFCANYWADPFQKENP